MNNQQQSNKSNGKLTNAEKQHNQQYKQALDRLNNQHISMDEFLSNNPSVKEYIKVLANSIIREEINKLVLTKTSAKYDKLN